MYDSARFFAMTGDVMEEYNYGGVFDRTEEVKILFEKLTNGSIVRYENSKGSLSSILSATAAVSSVSEPRKPYIACFLSPT